MKKIDCSKLLDKNQQQIHTHFAENSYLHSQEMVQKVLTWVTFWRRNPVRFVQYYFNLTLHLYQQLILCLMDICPSICIVAARSAAKSFIIAVFACKEAILRPNSKIVIASATKGQARLIVSEKIRKEILPNAPLLNAEISSFRDGQNETEVCFHNGSSIIVVPASENARGHRATILIYEEFRMIAKNIIDEVLSPMLFTRQAEFLKNEEYVELIEEPKEIFISSAWYKSHWMWDLIKILSNDMFERKNAVVIAMDYSIALKHNIKTRSFMRKEKKKLDNVSWAIEYENKMIAENTHAYFTYDMLSKCRVLKRPFYPRRDLDVALRNKNKLAIPRQDGEVRIVSCDIAPEGGEGNDNSIFSCIRLLPEKKEYKSSDANGDHIEVSQGYRRQVMYLEAQNQFETSKQAMRIKQLFYDFDADYCVLDTRNAGISVFDCLAKVMYDEERNMEYPPWTCINDENVASRIVISGQIPCVYSVKASLELNSRIAVCMRTTLTNKMIEILVDPQDGVEQIQKFAPEYDEADVDTQLYYERPYIETVALINEMIELEYTVMNQTGAIRIEEKGNARKDRYTSVSYGNYFAELLEHDLFKCGSEYEYEVFID